MQSEWNKENNLLNIKEIHLCFWLVKYIRHQDKRAVLTLYICSCEFGQEFTKIWY